MDEPLHVGLLRCVDDELRSPDGLGEFQRPLGEPDPVGVVVL